MKNLLIIAIALTFAASSLFAYTVNFTYKSEEGYSTNYTETVAPGTTFVGEGTIPPDRMIFHTYWKGSIPQQERKTCSLFVGIDEYDPDYGPGDLDSCENDADLMQDTLTSAGFFSYADSSILKSSEAKKAVIRQRISDAAKDLETGDIFLYFHSSHGDEDPYLICTYDASYYATELAEDLSNFKDGVKIIVILDSCFSGGMVPPESFANAVLSEMASIRSKACGVSFSEAANDLKTDAVFLTASQADELSFTYGEYSLFTSAFYFGFDSLSDLNADGLLSFEEVFERAYEYVIAVAWQEPYVSNPKLADQLFASPIPQACSYGALTVRGDTFSYEFPNVSQDLDIFVVDVAKPKETLFTVNKLSLKTDMRSDLFAPYYPTKLDFAFTIKGGASSKNAKEAKEVSSFMSTLWLENCPIIIGQTEQYVKENKSGTSAVFNVMDYSFNLAGKFQVKQNKKKGETKCSLKLNSLDSYWSAFTPLESGSQEMSLVFSLGETVFPATVNVSKKYKAGKSFAAKLVKSK